MWHYQTHICLSSCGTQTFTGVYTHMHVSANSRTARIVLEGKCTDGIIGRWMKKVVEPAVMVLEHDGAEAGKAFFYRGSVADEHLQPENP